MGDVTKRPTKSDTILSIRFAPKGFFWPYFAPGLRGQQMRTRRRKPRNRHPKRRARYVVKPSRIAKRPMPDRRHAHRSPSLSSGETTRAFSAVICINAPTLSWASVANGSAQARAQIITKNCPHHHGSGPKLSGSVAVQTEKPAGRPVPVPVAAVNAAGTDHADAESGVKPWVELAAAGLDELTQTGNFSGGRNQRQHDFHRRGLRPCEDPYRAEQSAQLHGVHSGAVTASRLPRCPSIGFASCANAVAHFFRAYFQHFRQLLQRVIGRGQKFVQRRVEQIVTGPPSPITGRQNRHAVQAQAPPARHRAGARFAPISCAVPAKYASG